MPQELQCLENIIPDLEVYQFQNIGTQLVLLNKKMLLAFDTGTGKTFTYALIARALLNNNPEKKHIFVIIHDSIEQARKDLRGLVAAPVEMFDAREGQLSKLMTMWDRLSVIGLTYECFQNMQMALFLYTHMREIESITLDEAHHAANWDVSDTAFMLRALCRYPKYIIELTATPMTSSSSQFYRLLNMADRNISFRRDENYTGKYKERYYSVNRKDYDIKGNYKTHLELVDPQPNQIGRIKGIISRVIKGTGAVNQVSALLRLIEERLRDNKRVIVYVNYHDSRLWIEQHLEMHNISYVSLHGRITKVEDRRRVLSDFSEGYAKVLITSIAESLNIDADVVIFYEFTTKLKQVMGRAHRGLAGKELELIFLITKDTMEVEYFLQYIYERSLTIQKLLKKDYTEFIKVGEKLKELQFSEDT